MLHPALRVTAREGGAIHDVLADRHAREPERTGLHCSTIVNDMMQLLYPSKYRTAEESDISEVQRLALWEFGNTYEDIVGRQLRRRVSDWEKPAPREYRGIWFSPDGWSASRERLDEIKATWVSRREFTDSVKFMQYMYQALPYAHVWGARVVKLHVLFVVADYKRAAPFPLPVTYTVRWDDPNVPKMYFDQLVQHAKDRGLL